MLSPEYAGRRNLRSLRQIVSEPEPSVLAMLRDIQEHSASAFIRETLGVFTNMTEQTFSGVYSTASKDTQWLSLDSYAALVCSSAFKSSDIVSGKKDVFLNIPASILRSYPGIGRVIIGSLINAMTQADGSFKRRALFMLDEVDLPANAPPRGGTRPRPQIRHQHDADVPIPGAAGAAFREGRCGVVDRRMRLRLLCRG